MSDPAQGYAGLTDGVRLVAAGATGVEPACAGTAFAPIPMTR
nr:hypothetical protein [uncultured Tistrella sp.]